MLAVAMLVVLRVTIGWHFFYEGVWKIKHAEKFSAEPFLSQAKGPAAPLFYAMVPDLDGGRRLKIEKDEDGKSVITGQCFLDVWHDLRRDVEVQYGFDDKQKEQAKAVYEKFAKTLRAYLAENLEDIEAYFGSLDRFERERAAGTNRSAYKKKRDWDRQQELRREVKEWLSEIEAMGDGYRSSLWAILNEKQRAEGSLPVAWTQSDWLDFAVTYGLTAIGLCLMVGFCTRLAALGGAAFLVSVLLTQPPWPTIYPPAPEVVGHALVIDKNFVEMIAVLVLAVTPVGRWAGLDHFLYEYVCIPLRSCMNKKEHEGKPDESDS